MKKLLLILLSMFFVLSLLAQDRNDAVVYIQSDKSIPFYVKMEGQMMERFSKHYVILNNLASGPLHLEILFQQNQYPAQKFVLNVAPSAQRSLVLQKVSDQKFALYDVNYGIYLQEGNKLTDDIDARSPAVAADVPNMTNLETANSSESAKDSKPRVVKEKRIKAAKDEDKVVPFVENRIEKDEESAIVKKERKSKQKIDKTDEERADRFLDFEFDKTEKETKSRAAQNSTLKSNANCTEAASEDLFQHFLKIIAVSDDEETNLAVIRKNAKYYCFSTDQVQVIALKFLSQSSRYEVTRLLKPRVVDKEAYSQLSSLFNTNYLKERFINEVVGR
jgi:hypothetical protein